MRNVYITSLCWHGLIGGALYIREDHILYHTGKLIDPKLRNLQMFFSKIISMEACNGILPFVQIQMRNGEAYKFLVFARKQFLNRVKEKRNEAIPAQ